MQGAIQAFAPCRPALKTVFTENIEGSAAVLRPSNSKIAFFISYAIILFIILSIFGSPDAMSMVMDFDQFKWKNRLLFLFAPERNDPLFRDLKAEISFRKNEVDDRDLVVFEIFESGPSTMNTTLMDPQTAAALRKHFGLTQKTFALILLGKDGGIKLKRNDRVKLEEIFTLIDSMPMRKDEMRQKGQSF
jgi:Domain of unknown function (DUF4174)